MHENNNLYNSSLDYNIIILHFTDMIAEPSIICAISEYCCISGSISMTSHHHHCCNRHLKDAILGGRRGLFPGQQGPVALTLQLWLFVWKKLREYWIHDIEVGLMRLRLLFGWFDLYPPPMGCPWCLERGTCILFQTYLGLFACWWKWFNSKTGKWKFIK